MRIALLIAAGLLARTPARAAEAPERADPALRAVVARAIEGFHGDVGVYVRRLRDGRAAAIRADEAFPTASLIKIPILIALFEKLDRGELDYNQPMTYRVPKGRDFDDDLMGSVKDGAVINLDRLILLMLTLSDNTAAIWCESLAGDAAINGWLESRGFKTTRLNKGVPGREAEAKRFGWGQTTPREMASLLVMIREGRAVSPSASEEMFRALSRSFFDTESLSRVPPTAHVASKQGALDHSRSEVLLVGAPSGDYVLCVITKNQKDASWVRGNEGYELLRRVSGAVWGYFEGKAWRPAPGMERYFKA